MPVRYVSSTTTRLYRESTGSKYVTELLWGDRVQTAGGANGRVYARARGSQGYVAPADLGDDPLLEFYFIDVGQGDGVLICTPDRRHILIDGGYKRSAQPTGKNAADFVDWKFAKDYREEAITLDAMVASHCDADHYGGLWDLINPDETEELDLPDVRVHAFYHAGVGWFTGPSGKRQLNPKHNGYLTELSGGRTSLQNALRGTASGYTLQGNWADFVRCLLALKAPRPAIRRISDRTGYLPGFDEGSAVSVKVLAPVEDRAGGSPRLRAFSSDSQNTNGHSVVLRVDYGRVRVLLTGDLNAASQAVLLGEYEGRRQDLAADVTKACHHGSDDCSYEFLANVSAAATIISSGDNEGHAHPRPSIVSASALTGHLRIQKDRVVTPLVYSTEIARSVRIGRVENVRIADYDSECGVVDVDASADRRMRVRYREVAAGDVQARTGERSGSGLYAVTGVVYGLVNVRTDGSRILCATLNEKSNTWDTREFESRF